MKGRFNWKKISLAGVALVGLNLSCTNLDENLYDTIAVDNFFKSEEEFVAALGNAYTNLYGYAGNGNLYSVQEVTSDEMVVPTRGNDWNDGGNWVRLHLHTYTPDDDRIRDSWNFCFGGVATCNRLIEQFEGLDVAGKDAFIAELKAFRALFYYWLLDIYGNVPIETSFSSANPQPANKTRAEVFAFVESELKASIPLLSREVGGAAYGRMNYYAAQTVLAKLYLNAEVYTGTARWAEAGTALDEIINSGRYSLAGNFFDNFKTENSGSPEFIFAIPYDQVFARGFNLPQMTLHYGSQATYNLQAQPWNGFCSLQEFYESFEDDDIRKRSFLVGTQFSSSGDTIKDDAAEPNDPDGKPLTFTPEINQLRPLALRQAGARVGKFEFALGATPDLSNDFPVFRYADVLLMKAEVLLRTGNAGGALTLVNQIRDRAGVADFTSLDLDQLLAERGRELFSEVHRRTDLIRFGKYNDAWWEKPADPSTHVNILPIPRAQLDANPNLRQNPGY